MIKRSIVATVGVCAIFSHFGIARAAEINGLALESLKSSLEQLIPEFRRSSGHSVTFRYGNSSTLPQRLAAGEPFDVVFASAMLIDRYTKEGKIAGGTRADVARVAIGMGVKKGAARPDISTTDAFKRTLVNATSISHASEGPSGIYLQNLLKRLDILSQVQPKLRPVAGGPLVMGPVAKGDVEIGIITVPFIVREPGVDLVGSLPDELQDYVVYSAGIAAATKSTYAASALVKHIISPAAASAFRSEGLDPVTN